MKKYNTGLLVNVLQKTKISVLSFLMLSTLVASAQSVSLQECIEMGLKNHPDYQAGVLSAESANADFLQAKSLRYPTMGIEVYQSTNTGRSIDRFTNSYINQVYNSTYAQARLRQPIFQGFRIQNTIRQSELLRDAQKLNLSSTQNQLTIQIIQAYLDVLASEELYLISQNQVVSSQAQLDQITKQVSAGVLGKTEELQIKTQLANDQFSNITASGNVRASRLGLFQLMNSRSDANTSFERLNSTVLRKYYNNNLTENALQNLPEIKAANLEIQSFDSQIKATKAGKLPTLNFIADWNTFYASSNPEQEFFEQINATRNGSFTLGLSIPIFGKLQTNPRIQSVSIQKRMAENRLATTRLRINQAVQTAVQNYTLAAERYENAQSQVAVNQENLDAIQSQIDAGTLNSIQYILAKTNFDRANSNLVQAKYSFLLQEKILNFYEQGEWAL
ncbi:MAG: outer membrane protein [Arcticibacterium sp.]|jgi:outer membrane protein